MPSETVVGVVGIFVFWIVFVAGLLRIRSWERAHPGASGARGFGADRSVAAAGNGPNMPVPGLPLRESLPTSRSKAAAPADPLYDERTEMGPFQTEPKA